MTTTHHEDAGPATAVEEAIAVLDAPRPPLPTRDRTHLAAVGPRTATVSPGDARVTAPTPSGTGTATSGGAPARRLRLVPGLPPVPTRSAPPPVAPPLLAERSRRLAAADPRTADDDDRGQAPAGDASRFAHGVGLACVEVTLGRRPVAQLARWVGIDVLEMLQGRADLVRRSGVLTHARRPVARRVRVCTLDTHTAEACLVVDDGARVRAVALRLEAHRGAWRVTSLEIG